MKTLNLLMLCTIIIIVSASCVKENPPQGPIYLANIHEKEIQVRAELYGNSFVIENGYVLEICGECFCNRGCKSSVYISGTINLDTTDNSFKIVDGKFELTVENQTGSMDILSGEIQENHGFHNGSLFKISGYIKVGCGTGCLYADDGKLKFIVQGNIGEENVQSAYKIDISGLIE